MKKLILTVAMLVCACVLHAQTSQILPSTTPLFFTSTGTGVFNQSVVYHSYAKGFVFELAKLSNDVHANPMDFRIGTRGATHNFFTIKGATGNVGIGTTTPGASLEVKGNTGSKLLFFDIKNESPSWKDQISINGDIDTPYGIAFSGKGHHRGGLYAQNIGAGSDANITLWSRANGYILLDGNRIGVGTTTPQQKLDVNGNVKSSGYFMTDSYRNLNTDLMLGYANNKITLGSGNPSQSVAIQSGGKERIKVTANGNVGIGATSPQGKFEIYSIDENKEIYFRAQHDGRNQNSDSPRLNFVAYNQSAGFGLQAVNSGGYGKKDLVFSAHKASDYTTYYEAARLTYDGKLGIGVANPSSRLDVKGDGIFRATDNTVGLALHIRNTNETNSFTLHGYTTKGQLRAQNGMPFEMEDSAGNKWFYGQYGGNVGIGTTSPGAKLDVNGNVKASSFQVKESEYYSDLNSNMLSFSRNGYSYINNSSAGGSIAIRTGGVDNVDLLVNSNGDVGIGTTDTKGFKLGVNGRVAATEVKVATYTNWSDFVFEENYDLPTLIEVENHIKKKGHLKDIPSAKEVEKDGFYLGEMDAKLLQKIEELTLYTIQQEKSLHKKDLKIEKLEKETNELKERLEKIEALLLKK